MNQCARQDGHSTSGSEAWDGSAPIHSFIYFFMKKLTPVPSPHLRCFSAFPLPALLGMEEKRASGG